MPARTARPARIRVRRWYLYLLRCRDGSLYAGITTDVPARLRAHNAGRGAKYVRSRLPATLAWRSAALTEPSARRREHALKRLPKADKERLVAAGGTALLY